MGRRLIDPRVKCRDRFRRSAYGQAVTVGWDETLRERIRAHLDGHDLRAPIHAPTGAVLWQLRWLCLEGRGDPVDELEQPVFAWK